MNGGKFLVVLGLALCATSKAALNDTHVTKTATCLQREDIIKNISLIETCFGDMLSYKMLGKTVNATCRNFHDFNKTIIRNLDYTSRHCNNNTHLKLTQATTTFLRMVKTYMDDPSLRGLDDFSCLTNKGQLGACNPHKLPSSNETGIAQKWLRRVLLEFDDKSCTRIMTVKNCTMAVVKSNCRPNVVNYIDTIYDLALKNCPKNDKKNSQDPSYLVRSSYLILFTIALTRIYQ